MNVILQSVGIAAVFVAVGGISGWIGYKLGLIRATQEALAHQLGNLETRVGSITERVAATETNVTFLQTGHFGIVSQVNAIQATIIDLVTPRQREDYKKITGTGDPQVVAIREKAAADATVVRAKGVVRVATLVVGGLVTLALRALGIHVPWPTHISS
jgi:hypothetical protein